MGRSRVFTVLLGVGIIALIASALLSIASGPINISLSQVVHLLMHRDNSTDSIIIYSSRLPRTIVAIFAGAAFAVAGCIMQAVSRNPLACPSILGINQGAALCIVVMLLLVPGITTLIFIPIAFLGGLIAAALIFLITATVGMSPLRLALAGVTVNALFHAISRALLILFPNNAQAVIFSTMGSLGGRTWTHVDMILPWIAVGLVLSVMSYRYLNLFNLGQEHAKGLGLNANRAQFVLLLLAVVLASSAVSVVGPIPFVGLIIPNAMRYVMGANHRYLVPLSIVYGALLLLLSDTLIRLFNPVVEIPVGIIVALIGGPFFVFVARTQTKGGSA